MARYNFTNHLDDKGYKVHIYTKFNNNFAKVYSTATSTVSIQAIPQITTDSSGLVSFWVDTDDYSYGQRFTIIIYTMFDKHYSSINDINIFSVPYNDTLNPLAITSGGTGHNNGVYQLINVDGASESAGATVYGTGSGVIPGTTYSSLVPHLLTAIISGTVGTSETITAQPTLTYSNSTAAVVLASQSLAAGSTGSLIWDLASIAGSYVSGSYIIAVSLAASSSATTTTATIIGNVKGLQFV